MQARQVPRGLAASGFPHFGHGSAVRYGRRGSEGGSQVSGSAGRIAVTVASLLAEPVSLRFGTRERWALLWAARQASEWNRAVDRFAVNEMPQPSRSHTRSRVTAVMISSISQAQGNAA